MGFPARLVTAFNWTDPPKQQQQHEQQQQRQQQHQQQQRKRAGKSRPTLFVSMLVTGF